MARVTVTNNAVGTYLIPSPISKKIGSGQTEVFDGILAADLEKGHVLQQAIADGTITVVVSDDPNMPNELEVSVLKSLADKGANFRTDEFTNPALADVNALKASVVTSIADRTFSGTALDGVVGAAEMIPPRNITVTSSDHADCTVVNVVFTGTVRNELGELVSQTSTLASILGTGAGGGGTRAGTKPFSFITSIFVPLQGGAGGALEFGFGEAIGLSALVKSRAGLIKALSEIEAGVAVTTGTFTNPTGSAVALYTPATPPDAANDYAVFYEVG